MSDDFPKITARVHPGKHTITPGEGEKVSSLALHLRAFDDQAIKVLELVPGMRTARVATILKRKGMGSFRCVAKLRNLAVDMPKDEGDSPGVSFSLLYTEPMATLKKGIDFLASFADSHHEDCLLTMEQMQPELPEPPAGEGSEAELPLD